MYTPEVVSSFDKRLIQDQAPTLHVRLPPATESWQTKDASTGLQPSTVRFEFQDMNENYVLNRRMYLRYVMDYTITSTAGNPSIFPVGAQLDSLGVIGLVPYAFQRAASAYSIFMNSTEINIQNYRYLDALRDYNKSVIHYQQRMGSIMPNKQNLIPEFDLTYGTPASPFAPRYTDTYSGDGGWSFTPTLTLISDNGATAVVRVEGYEFLTWLFNSKADNCFGLTNCNNNLKITFSIDTGILSSGLKIDADNLDVATCTFTQHVVPPLIIYDLITSPGINMVEQKMASEYYVSNFGINTFPIGTFNSGQTRVITTTSNYNYSTWPKYMLIYAKRDDETSFMDSDYLHIDRINTLYIGNKNINVITKDPEYWYETLLANGLSISWDTFKRKGVPWVVDLKADFPEIPAEYGPGVPMSKNIKFDIQFTNLTSSAGDYTFYALDITDYRLVLGSGNFSTYTQFLVEPSTIISEAEVASMDIIEKEEQEYSQDALMSGSLLGNMKKSIKKGVGLYNKHSSAINEILATGMRLGVDASQLLLPLLAGGLKYDEAVRVLRDNNIPLPGQSGSLSMGALTNSAELRSKINAGSLKPYNNRRR